MAASVTGEILFWKRLIQCRDKLAEGVGAVANRMFSFWIELAKGLAMADWDEHRIVAKAAVPPRRPGERAVHPPFKRLSLAIVGPGDRQRADEVRGRVRVRLGRGGLGPYPLHRPHPVAVALFVLGPAG